MVHPIRYGNRAGLDLAQAFVEHGSVSTVVVDRYLANYAASIRARHNLTLVDSVIVATAAASGCDALIGNDKRCAERVTEIPYIYLDEAVRA